jgi:hypothetical protein
MRVVRLSALRTGPHYLPGDISDTHFSCSLSRSYGHRATEKVKLVRNEPASFRLLALLVVVSCPFQVQSGSACWHYRLCVLFSVENTSPNTVPHLIINIHLWWGAFRNTLLSNACFRTSVNFLCTPFHNRVERSIFLALLSLMTRYF